MPDFLGQMAASSRARAGHLTPDRLRRLTERIGGMPEPISFPRDTDRFGVIAEVKLRSPASGRLVPPGDDTESVVSLAIAYEEGGASAISVLTEPDRFDGALDHLGAVAEAVSVPVMRKDFLVDPAQLVESRAYGASGILLIARILGRELMTKMIDQARQLGLFALIELFEPEDLGIVGSVDGSIDLIGVNTRDLGDLSVRPERLETMAPHLPADVPWVAESGLSDASDAARAAALGYRYALVGTGLATANDPGSVLREMVGAGRATRERAW
jgi:indole-3-glycerol phosphate synthase